MCHLEDYKIDWDKMHRSAPPETVDDLVSGIALIAKNDGNPDQELARKCLGLITKVRMLRAHITQAPEKS